MICKSRGYGGPTGGYRPRGQIGGDRMDGVVVVSLVGWIDLPVMLMVHGVFSKSILGKNLMQMVPQLQDLALSVPQSFIFLFPMTRQMPRKQNLTTLGFF